MTDTTERPANDNAAQDALRHAGRTNGRRGATSQRAGLMPVSRSIATDVSLSGRSSPYSSRWTDARWRPIDLANSVLEPDPSLPQRSRAPSENFGPKSLRVDSLYPMGLHSSQNSTLSNYNKRPGLASALRMRDDGYVGAWNPKLVGSRIAVARAQKIGDERGSLTRLSEMAGIDKAALSRIEHGKVPKVAVVTILAICDALGARLEWVLFGRGEMFHNDPPAPAATESPKQRATR